MPDRHQQSALQRGKLTLALACVCSAGGLEAATILEIPVRRNTEVTQVVGIDGRREFTIRDADLALSFRADRSLTPQARFDFRQIFTDRSSFSYSTDIGLQGLQALPGDETELNFDLRLSIKNRAAFDWRSTNKRWRSRLMTNTDDTLILSSGIGQQRMSTGYDASYAAGTSSYNFQTWSSSFATDGRTSQRDHTGSVGWSRSLAELPISLDARTLITATERPLADQGHALAPQVESGVTWQVDPTTRLRMGTRARQDFGSDGLLDSESRFLFSSFDWRLAHGFSLRLEGQVGERDSFDRFGRNPTEREEVQVRISPRIPITERLRAEIDYLHKANRRAGGGWASDQESLFFSIGGTW